MINIYKVNKIFRINVFVGLFLFISNDSFALVSSFNKLLNLQKNKVSNQITKQLEQLRFSNLKFSQQSQLNLVSRSNLESINIIKSYLYSNGVPLSYEIKVKHLNKNEINSSNNTYEVLFYFNHTKICNLMLKISVSDNGSFITLGSIPNLENFDYISKNDWLSLESSLELILDRVFTKYNNNDSKSKIVSSSKCLLPNNQSLLPAWNIKVSINGLIYKAFVSNYKVYKLMPDFFEVDGTTKVYKNSDLDGKTETFTIEDMDSSGLLESKYFKLSSLTNSTVVNSSLKFDYEPDTEEFLQSMVFSHANEHRKYLEKIGFKWYGDKSVSLRIHENPRGINNALFIPSFGDDNDVPPSIYIGDGDGVALMNLARDADVVSHEFGHFVIYKTLQSTTGESLVLHEGLADFLTFARTQNSCLGEYICPEESLFCAIKKKCLRTASNDIKYDDVYQTYPGHIKGQLISGLLWDLYETHKIPIDTVGKLVMDSIALLPLNAGLKNFFMGLFYVDSEKYQQKYYDIIKKAMLAREMDTIISDLPKKGHAIDDPSKIINNEDEGDSTVETKSSKSILGISCGTIGNHNIASFFLLLMLFCPLVLLPSKKRIVVKK